MRQGARDGDGGPSILSGFKDIKYICRGVAAPLFYPPYGHVFQYIMCFLEYFVNSLNISHKQIPNVESPDIKTVSGSIIDN